MGRHKTNWITDRSGKPLSDVDGFDIDQYLGRALEALKNDIDLRLEKTRILKSKKDRKYDTLAKAEGETIVRYINCLREMENDQDEALKQMTDEQMENFLMRKKRLAKLQSKLRAKAAATESAGEGSKT